jgi:hypothetical protein
MMLDEPRARPMIVLVFSSTVIYFVYVLNNDDIDTAIFFQSWMSAILQTAGRFLKKKSAQ